jgi:hypothetical protein
MRATKMSENRKRKSSRRRIGTESKAGLAGAVNTDVRRRVQNVALDRRGAHRNTRRTMTRNHLHIPAADLGLISILVILPR